jgi:hypothetical protein
MLTGSDFLGTSWRTIYNVISGNVADPLSRNVGWIHDSFPDITNPGSSFYPRIVIDNFQPRSDIMAMGTLRKPQTELTSVITIYTNNGSQLDYLTERVWNALYSQRNVLLQSGLKGLSLKPQGTDTVVIDRNNKIHSESFGLETKVDVR